ncbi:AAA family ATPase [Corynebacterium afermentans]|uniref:AAA family ATPase n=1 Tax=Corynebacterium afermentans TaxID=38286 RepID=UPI002573BA43|nr:ATP-binding protein [Corynebacterium afermentans]
MFLLNFTVANFRSIRDPQTVDFAEWPGGGNSPKQGWRNVVSPVTVLMGPNASGKSNFLEAFNYVREAIRASSTSWQDEERFPNVPFFPFRLSEAKANEPSSFELDFVVDQTRYLYGFQYGKRGVISEWMSYVPSKRWSKLFERTVDKGKSGIDWNSSRFSKSTQNQFKQLNQRELLLSAALRRDVEHLSAVADSLLRHLTYVPLGDSYKDTRISQVAARMRKGFMNLSDISQLLNAADTGIIEASIDERNLTETQSQVAQKLLENESPDGSKLTSITASNRAGEYIEINVTDEDLETIAYQLVFKHRGSDGVYTMKLVEESDGTLTWLSIAPLLLDALRGGGVVVADELDSSLHQQLLEMVVSLFSNPEFNPLGAQIIFSSHDTNLLEHINELNLRPSSFWFVEKDRDGGSEIEGLASFDNHRNANYERRYLSGRYGGLPRLSLETFAALIVDGDHD